MMLDPTFDRDARPREARPIDFLNAGTFPSHSIALTDL
jgi:hypothetical protein